MNELNVYTLEDLNKLKGIERRIALDRWQAHNKMCWYMARREIRRVASKVIMIKNKGLGLCPCGRAREFAHRRCKVCLRYNRKGGVRMIKEISEILKSIDKELTIREEFIRNKTEFLLTELNDNPKRG